MSERPIFERVDRDDVRILVARGEIDVACRSEFQDQIVKLISEARSPAYVDLSQVTFLDSSGLGVLVGGMKVGKTRGVEVVLLSPQPNVLRVLEISGLDEIFTIRDAT
jgi:anti-sigma B factor antagonist